MPHRKRKHVTTSLVVVYYQPSCGILRHALCSYAEAVLDGVIGSPIVSWHFI